MCCEIETTAKCRIGLTGTPIQNDPFDLWALFHVIHSELFGDQAEFNAHYTKVIKRGRQSSASELAVAKTQERLTLLQKRVKPHFLHRTKEKYATQVRDNCCVRTTRVFYSSFAHAKTIGTSTDSSTAPREERVRRLL